MENEYGSGAGEGISRRGFLKELGRYGAAAVVLASPITLSRCSGCGDGVKIITTDDAYGDYSRAYKEQAKLDVASIKEWDKIVDKSDNDADKHVAQSRLLNLELDYILTEFPYLKQEGLIEGNIIDMGKYRLEVVSHRNPATRYLDGAGETTDDVEVELKVYKDGVLVDLNWSPWEESKTIDLGGKDWRLKDILDKKTLF